MQYFEALVRQYQPKGYKPYFAGCARREGVKRVSMICRHQHADHDSAQACAENIIKSRGGKVVA